LKVAFLKVFFRIHSAMISRSQMCEVIGARVSWALLATKIKMKFYK